MLWILTSVALALSPADLPNPRESGGWVLDQAEILPPEVRESLNAQIQHLYDDVSAEVAVVTVPTADRVPKEFATALFETWGIGDSTTDNGLLILLVMDARRLEMETGYGLEAVLSDGWLGTMQQTAMVPQFQAGRFDLGLVAGMNQIDARLRMDPEGQGIVAPVRQRRAERPSERSLLTAWGGMDTQDILTFLGFGAFGVIFFWAFFIDPILARRRMEARGYAPSSGSGGSGRGRSRRLCGSCGSRMRPARVTEATSTLPAGLPVTMDEGSVAAWQCTLCEGLEMATVGPADPDSCGSCGMGPLELKSTVLTKPTEHSTGDARLERTCLACREVLKVRVVVPEEAPLDTSWRGAAASFGGSVDPHAGGGSSFSNRRTHHFHNPASSSTRRPSSSSPRRPSSSSPRRPSSSSTRRPSSGSSKRGGGSFGGGRSGGGGAGSSW